MKNPGLKIRISPHARERLEERMPINFLYRKIVENAYIKGDLLNDEEVDIMFKKGMLKDNYWSSDYRKYADFIFVFRTDKRKIILITILPEWV